jgi:hypothetical protein
MTLLVIGRSLALELATRLFHGPLGPGMTLNLHPTALAAWLGLFATALNLLPLASSTAGTSSMPPSAAPSGASPFPSGSASPYSATFGPDGCSGA